MEKSSFFNSVDHDRTYKAEDWAAYFSSLIGNGVFPQPSTGLQVVMSSGMTVLVRPGKAWINGYFYTNTSDLSVPLATADGQLKRIDRIVVRWNLTNRVISVNVKSSPYSAAPVAPALQRDADVFELALADILVNPGTTAVTQSAITDQRLNSSLCGVVAAVVNQIDTSAFNAQLQAWYNEYTTAMQTEFASWFETLQDVLAEDVAANLLAMIQSLDANKVPITRKVNNKALSANITLTAADVGAAKDKEQITVKTATFSVSSTDLGKTFLMQNTSDAIVYLPTSVAVGFGFYVRRWGEGNVTISDPNGATINEGVSSVVMGEQYEAVVAVVRVSETSWSIIGGLE